jgi:hypothetical protein
MADGYFPAEPAEGFFIEDLRNQPHFGENIDPSTVGCGNAGAFLSSVLKSK